MADLLPILSKEEEEEVDDSPDTARFRELPPAYSETESVDVHTSKQVFVQTFATTIIILENYMCSSSMFKAGDWRCGECRKFAGASRVYKTLVYPGALLWDGLPSGEMF